MHQQKKDLMTYALADYTCSCGHRHNTNILQINLDGDLGAVIDRLIRQPSGKSERILTADRNRLLLVADDHTWNACGKKLAAELAALAYEFETCVFPGDPVLIPDEKAVFTVMNHLRPDIGLLVAIGSGTLNDLTRFVGSRTGLPYYIVATSPSMDGYASTVSPLIVNNMKVTLEACGASAILADPAVLANSPDNMLAAGLGDILGKYSAICDWRVGALIEHEYYCEPVASLVLDLADECRAQTDAVKRRDPHAARTIMEGLILSGIAMSYIGNSRPASGSEHHLSHFWEMAYQRQGRAPVPHGSKVGLAVIITCALYRRLLSLKPDFAAARARLNRMSRETWLADMRRIYQAGADELIELDAHSSKNDPVQMAVRIDRLEKEWPNILSIIKKTIPEPDIIRRALADVGGATRPSDLGLEQDMVADGLRFAREIRNRYTVLQLYADLDMTEVSVKIAEELWTRD